MTAESDNVLTDLGVAQGLVVRPGDTLIVGLSSSNHTPDQAALLKQQIEDRLPNTDVLVICGVDQMAVYRPGSPDGA